ncbi:hypothetical protein EYZ11_002386 [Aspergillus tanneri]|uniref:Uncharacterized protein n=1 Tax=Aspergillus tanneri TaxID=1220188 RepID=A0A4S3JR32_9EURO|nr:hypothetical protein EYZ11_002386 [Aspergillus tanneri]
MYLGQGLALPSICVRFNDRAV